MGNEKEKNEDLGTEWLEDPLKVDPPNKEGDNWMRDGVKKLDRRIRNPPIDPPDNDDPERKYPE